MNSEQELFLKQARSAYDVFLMLKASTSIHHCHALHYLQMASELLGKAHAWRNGPISKSHKAIVPFLRSLSTNSKVQDLFGFHDQNASWKQAIRKFIDLAQILQNLAPTLAVDGPNPEYPWPPDRPTNAPVLYSFPLWAELLDTIPGRKFLEFVDKLFRFADSFL